MPFKNNKGTLFYTLAGIMVAAIVLVIALHVLRTTYDPADADQIRLQRFTNALYDLENRIGDGARYAEYPAIWKAGHNMTPEGVNYYLTIYDGRDKMKKDLTLGFTQDLNAYLQSIATSNDSDKYFIDSKGIPFTVYRMEPTDVSITESPAGMTYNMNLRIKSEDGKYRFDHTVNQTSEVPARLFAMYDKAKAFNDKYVENVQWATTIALYARAYYGAYDPTYSGSFLKEGHVAYDPLDQVLRGDLVALQNFKADSIDDLGSIPAATWLTEWEILGEPAYLPTGVDMEIGKEGNAKITDLIKNAYDMQKAAGCDTLSGENKTACEEFNDPETIRVKANDVKTEREKMQALSDEIKDWGPSTGMTCEEFREGAEKVISDATDEFGRQRSEKGIIDPSMSYAGGTVLNDDIRENTDEIKKTETAVNALESIRDTRLPPLSNSLCALPSDMDCKCGKGPDDYCNADSTYCKTCDNPSCNKITCDGGGADYSCSSLKLLDDGGDPIEREEHVNCTITTCDENGCEDDDGSALVWIPLCNCQCHPSSAVVSDTVKQLAVIQTKIDDRLTRFQEQEIELNQRADTLEAAQSKFDEINSLTSGGGSSGYDVISRIDYNNVKYFDTTTSAKCYLIPTWAARQNGTCGDGTSSTVFYTAQISAAVICCGLTPGCCPVVEYSTQWFPAIYRVEGDYNISETVVDDKNRIMLHNLFAGDQDLYGYNVTPKLFTHVAPEFVIYRNYRVEVKSKTGSTIIVYLYLPKIAQTQAVQGGALNKILDSFTDSSCAGDSC